MTYSRAVNSPYLQILRIEREGMIDDITMHSTRCLLCKNILVDSDHQEYVVTQNTRKRCSWHTVNPLLSPTPPPPFQGKRVNETPSPPLIYSSLINDRQYESITTVKLHVD